MYNYSAFAQRAGRVARISMLSASSAVAARPPAGPFSGHAETIVGLQYQAAAQAVKRFARTLADDPERRRFVAKLKSEVSTI